MCAALVAFVQAIPLSGWACEDGGIRARVEEGVYGTRSSGGFYGGWLIRARIGPGFPTFSFPATRFRENAAINPPFSLTFPSEKNRQVWPSYSSGSRKGSHYELGGMGGNPPFQGTVYDGDISLFDGAPQIHTSSRFISRAHAQKKQTSANREVLY